MTQLSTKIKIPTKTKIAVIFAAVMSLLYTAIFIMLLIFDSDFSVDLVLHVIPRVVIAV